MDFVCPKCKRELALVDLKVKKCPLGHSFDRAKEGYYNLLLGSSQGVHGDNAEMVRSRREFLSYGYYEPMRRRVGEMILSATPSMGVVLDAGMGEGYYTSLADELLRERDGKSFVFGFDISKDAIRYAAKLYPHIFTAVASSYDMPLADGCVDTVMNIFSPMAQAEVLRVLKSGGSFVMVYPGEEHLFGLKCSIYDTPYKNEPQDTELAGFKLISSERMRYTATFEGKEQILSLFMMTPYAYRTGKSERERLLSLERVSTDIDFYINHYEKI